MLFRSQVNLVLLSLLAGNRGDDHLSRESGEGCRNIDVFLGTDAIGLEEAILKREVLNTILRLKEVQVTLIRRLYFINFIQAQYDGNWLPIH